MIRRTGVKVQVERELTKGKRPKEKGKKSRKRHARNKKLRNTTRWKGCGGRFTMVTIETRQHH